jgi:hypothetical protein
VNETYDDFLIHKYEEENTLKSWKTTAAGVAVLLVAVGSAAQAFLDNDPLTVPDWAAVLAAGLICIGLGVARDNKVTSEQAGAGA